MPIQVVKKDQAKVLYMRLKNLSGSDINIDGEPLPDGDAIEQGQDNKAGFASKFIKPKHITTTGNVLVNLEHFGNPPQVKQQFIGLLDEYPGAAASYSLRLLRSDYAGGLVRVMAWNGSASQGEADIMPYQVGSDFVVDLNSTLENLDAIAIGRGLTTSDTLADLVLTGTSNYDGLTPTWYDQDLLGNNATQASAAAMPQIISSGSLILESGKPVIDFGAIGGAMVLEVQSIKDLPLNSFSWFHVRKTGVSISPTPSIVFDGIDDIAFSPYVSSAGIGSRIFWRNLGSATEVDSGNISDQNFTFGFDYSATSNNYKVYRNNNEVVNFNTSGTAGPFNTFYLGGQPGFSYGSLMQEFVIYPTNQSTNRTAIETNINNFYSIY